MARTENAIDAIRTARKFIEWADHELDRRMAMIRTYRQFGQDISTMASTEGVKMEAIAARCVALSNRIDAMQDRGWPGEVDEAEAKPITRMEANGLVCKACGGAS